MCQGDFAAPASRQRLDLRSLHETPVRQVHRLAREYRLAITVHLGPKGELEARQPKRQDRRLIPGNHHHGQLQVAAEVDVGVIPLPLAPPLIVPVVRQEAVRPGVEDKLGLDLAALEGKPAAGIAFQIPVGIAPAAAIKYQIAIMISIFTGTAITVTLGIELTLKAAFSPFGILKEDIFK